MVIAVCKHNAAKPEKTKAECIMKCCFFLPVITFAWERLQPLSSIISGDGNLRLYGYNILSNWEPYCSVRNVWFSLSEYPSEIFKNIKTYGYISCGTS